MPVFNHDGLGFHYQLTGQGTPLVMCHGLTGDLSAPKDLLGEIPGYRLIVFDARAHGKTQPLGPVAKICFKQFAEDLAALLEHLEVQRAVVGGISMGAGVAVRFAIDFPHHAQALVLIRPAWLDYPLPDNLKLLPLVARLLAQFGPVKGRQAFDQHPDVEKLYAVEPALVDTLRQQFDAPLANERRERLVRMPQDSPIQNWREVESLTIPALVLGNEGDSIHPFAIAVQWAKHLRRGRLERVTTKSTDYEQYVRDVRRHLIAFLAGLSAGPILADVTTNHY